NDVFALSYQARLGAAVSRTVAAWYENTGGFNAEASFRSSTRRANAPDPAAEPLTAIVFDYDEVVRDLSLRQELTRPVGARHVLGAGFDLHHMRGALLFRVVGSRNPEAANGSSIRGGAGLPDLLDQASTYTRGGGWIEDRIRATDSLTLTPGLRLDGSG